MWRFKLENLIKSDYTIATDQIIRYPPVAGDSRYTFSLSAFPEATYAAVLADYFAFCKQYYAQQGYRTNMLNVGYWIAQDQSSLLSYSYDGPVMTIDPVSTGNPGLAGVSDRLQPVLRGARRHSAVQPDRRHHAGPGAGRPWAAA